MSLLADDKEALFFQKQQQHKLSTQLNHYNVPEANSQHGFQEFLDVWLDAGTHSSGKHADTSKNCGIHLHGLLSSARNKDGTEKSKDISS